MRKLAAFRKLSSPFVGDKPLDSISLCFYGDSTGIKEWNRSSDPMPIKTMNNNGLQVLEEVPGEYAIYIDKDAVFTTVQKYAPGSYQTFMERKVDVDNSRSLLKGYKIEWTQKDDSDLFIQCNNEAISKIENQPMTLDEPTQPVVLEPKTVPTTYECCFRVGNEGVYAGEGYENLFDVVIVGDSRNYSYSKTKDGYYTINKLTDDNAWFGSDLSSIAQPSTQYTFSFKSLDRVGFQITTHSRLFISSLNKEVLNTDVWYYITNTTKPNSSDFVRGHSCYVSVGSVRAGEVFNGYYQITKTSTPKPWVKTIQPTCKLDRITNANEATHAFLNKGDGVVTFGNGYFSLKGEKIQQLLVYNALLTEQEKQSELAKDIKLR